MGDRGSFWVFVEDFFKSKRILFKRERSQRSGNKSPVYAFRATAGIFIVLEH